jgi:hypothetical protein
MSADTPDALYTASVTMALVSLPSMLARINWLPSAMNMYPWVGSSAMSDGLVRLLLSTIACHRPFSSNTSTFWPTPSTTYSLLPTQSTATDIGSHIPGSVISGGMALPSRTNLSASSSLTALTFFSFTSDQYSVLNA